MYSPRIRRFRISTNLIIIFLFCLVSGFGYYTTGSAREGIETAGDISNAQGLLSNRDPDKYQALLEKAREEGTIKIFVGFSIDQPFVSEHLIESQDAIETQHKAIRDKQDLIIDYLEGTRFEVKSTYQFLPLMALDVDESGLTHLWNLPFVTYIEERKLFSQSLDNSVPWINGDDLHYLGIGGTGYTVAIIDSGIQSGHSTFLNSSGQSRVVSEACYSNDDIISVDTLCPNGTTVQTGTGSASATTTACLAPTSSDWDYNGNLCWHGTHVAGIAAGRNSTYTGLAPEANIIAIQVFFRQNEILGIGCDKVGPCLKSDPEDIIAALERVYYLRTTITNIVSVNMSLVVCQS